MKATTLILAALIPFSFWMGCKDNAIDPLGGQNSDKQNYTPDRPVLQTEREPLIQTDNNQTRFADPRYELVWHLDELTATTNDLSLQARNLMENSAVYSSSEGDAPACYIISFDAWTNADRWTNGYTGVARITKNDNADDNGVLFAENNFSPDPTFATEKYHKEISLDNSSFSSLTFYVALVQVDGLNIQPTRDPQSEPTVMTLSNINILKRSH